MTKELAVIPKGLNALSPIELGALSAVFRAARKDCRKVMGLHIWNKPVTETYRQIVVDFTEHDPLFKRERSK